MKEQIPVSLKHIQKIIDKLDTTFTTVDVLKKYSGGFYSNRNTPRAYSFNAQFGKILKHNEDKLNIVEIESDVDIKDDIGHRTATSVWKKK
ncbi:MAG: hypothetical protein WAR79_08925 [Melioribacteraceae bacterium]